MFGVDFFCCAPSIKRMTSKRTASQAKESTKPMSSAQKHAHILQELKRRLLQPKDELCLVRVVLLKPVYHGRGRCSRLYPKGVVIEGYYDTGRRAIVLYWQSELDVDEMVRLPDALWTVPEDTKVKLLKGRIEVRPGRVNPVLEEPPQTMKSLILYGSPTKLTNAHKLVTGRLQPKFYVRAKIVSGDCDTAMNKVKCMPGENLLNTQDIAEPMPPSR